MGTVLDSYGHGTYSWTAHGASAPGTFVTRSVRPHLLRVNKGSPTGLCVKKAILLALSCRFHVISDRPKHYQVIVFIQRVKARAVRDMSEHLILDP